MKHLSINATFRPSRASSGIQNFCMFVVCFACLTKPAMGEKLHWLTSVSWCARSAKGGSSCYQLSMPNNFHDSIGLGHLVSTYIVFSISALHAALPVSSAHAVPTISCKACQRCVVYLVMEHSHDCSSFTNFSLCRQSHAEECWKGHLGQCPTWFGVWCGRVIWTCKGTELYRYQRPTAGMSNCIMLALACMGTVCRIWIV